MKILQVGDIHIGANEGNQKFLNYQTKTLDWINSVYDSLNKNNDVILFQLGDLLENRKSISAKSLNMFINNFIDHRDRRFLLGNHDIFNKNNSDISILYDLKQLLNDKVYREVDDKSIDDICIVPWLNDESREIGLEKIKNSTAKYCIGHLELNGFEMNKGFLCKGSKFGSGSFENFKSVYSGHFHCKSQRGNINYIGACLELNWGDCGEPKQIVYLDTITGEEIYFENPYRFYEKIVVRSDEDEIQLDPDKNTKIILECERSIVLDRKLNLIEDEFEIIDKHELIKINGAEEISDIEDIPELWDIYLNSVDSEWKDDFNSKFHELYSRVTLT